MIGLKAKLMKMRKTLLLILLVLCLLSVAGCHTSQTQGRSQNPPSTAHAEKKNNRSWRAANYHGLVMGTSKYQDMLRVLGEPVRSVEPEGQPKEASKQERWYVYENAGEIEGKLMVVVAAQSQTILSIIISPENLTKDEAIKLFGDDHIITRYHFEPCLGDDESGPLYEAQDGALAVIEYRHRGIAIRYNYEDKVKQITYVSEPVGSQSSKCS